MTDTTPLDRLEALLSLVLEVADGNYSARIEPSDRGDAVDAVGVGLNLVAESLELERERRRRAEALLRDEVHAYEEAPAMFCSIDVGSSEIVKCNETLARALGVRKAELLNRRLLGFLPLEERPLAEAALLAICEGKRPEQTTFHLVDQDGQNIPVLLSGSVASPEGERLRLVFRDVSMERSLEAQLRQAQKLEAVGRLASGVAHDFNNILAVVLGSAALLKRILPNDHRGLREIAAIINAAENGTGLTRQLLALSKPIPDRQESSADLNELIRESQPLLLRSLGPANELVLELCDEDLSLRVDPSEMVQVLLNLTVNARDAMPDGGRLVVHTSRQVDERGAAKALIEVVDSGHGMPADMLGRVLEPFFTTKVESGGSGLGLAVCVRVVEQWRGALEVESEVGNGTRVRVAIPIVAAADEPAPAERLSSRTQRKRVLVVDDDPLVRDVLVRTVEAGGYEVLGAEGLSTALEKAGAVDELYLVVTDVVMPGGNGVELAGALWESRPDLGIIFVSGYTGSRIGAELLARDNVRFLAKPFDPGDLLQLISELGSQDRATIG